MTTTDPTSILTAHGLENAQAIVTAAAETGVDLALAAATAEQESGGRMVWGNDVGGVHSTPGAPDAPVTTLSALQFLIRVFGDGEKSNGWGLGQITWPPSIRAAILKGRDLTDPLDNARTMCELLAQNLEGGRSVEEAATLYNAGTLNGGVTAYGREVAAKAAAWRSRLNPEAAPADPDPTEKDTPMDNLLTLDQWAADVDGRRIVWGIYGAQCVDLVKDYAIRAHGAPPGAYGHGKDMARGLSRLDGWTYSGPNGTARRGMVVSGLPQAPWHEKYGHVWVLLEVHEDGTWTIKDQNPHAAATRRITPTGVAGMVMPPPRPGALSAAQEPSAGKVHTVQAGETLGRIAAAYGTTVEHLRAWNDIRDINRIHVGDRLIVSEPRPRYVITWDRLNIFTGPGTGYDKINRDPLLKGLPLVGTGRTADGWVELSTPYMDLHGQTGWAWGAGVSKVDA